VLLLLLTPAGTDASTVSPPGAGVLLQRPTTGDQARPDVGLAEWSGGSRARQRARKAATPWNR
jgi:hypothetical protein